MDKIIFVGYTWERPTRWTLFLINLFQLNYPLHVSNKYMFINRRLFLYMQHTVFYHASAGAWLWFQSHRV